ncbi:hypothetical protein ABB37_09145 [Leptomonas pyrrhocoris]|uniref:Uncharacterized protein n=1 Tax=Leptomonas pyrrhocoris TaxID=157538 RepID=A0A0M9FRM5_LEPPY|nr:hypothetical protein ABB37_09145 [Leptomonas pyrrhocoris]KPA74466.1 hypothetical protein ABB37_09145 [Leptomonas pyrrhocoris]|eukprot:XP_015652905.1 hypothetical protein ABB37_09145 [Leptomonas pyrrhocoris]
MFYTYAEKQGNVFFDGWQMRQLAFDTMRRHLYYSDSVTPEKIAYPNANDNPFPPATSEDSYTDGEDSYASLSTAGENPAVPHINVRPPLSPVSQQQRFNEAPPPPNNPEDVLWRKKIKVDMIVLVGKEHAFILEDTHLKETDLFQVEIHGEVRPLAQGETPAPGPLLTPSSGLSGLPERFTVENDEFIRDPFFLRELYEALRDQFADLRMERERAELASGQPVLPPSARRIQTLESPHAKNGTAYRGSRIKVVFRMRTDYEFRRFWYVVQTVLGYDKLSARPYRGLPPYDPRNGLIFSMIPMCVWHTFKALDKAVFYAFLRGDLVGRNASGGLCVALRGAYLCITHDTVLLVRDTGTIPRWIKLQQVREFHYNAASSRPFVAFLSDPGAPDIIFLPQPPIYGPDAIRRFSPSVEVLRLYHIIHETCFASLEIRRVIDMAEIPEMSVRGFVARYERETGRHLDFDPAVGYSSSLSCPLPKEQLAQVWREVQSIYASRDPSVVSRAAIPLYRNNTNDTDLSREQLETLSRRLARERASRDDIVGLSLEEAHRIEATATASPSSQQPRRRGNTHSAHSSHRNHSDSQSDVLSPQMRRTSSELVAPPSSLLPRSNTTSVAELERDAHLHRDLSLPHTSSEGWNDGSTSAASPGSPLEMASPSSQSERASRSRANRNNISSSDVYASPSSPSRGADTIPGSPAAATAGTAVAGAATTSSTTIFPQTYTTRTQIPANRLETPQLGTDNPVPTVNFGNTPAMGSSPGLGNASFASSCYGACSVQYQVPGARYLTAEELKKAGTDVAVDHHAVLMSQTPLGPEGAAQAFLTNSEVNVEEIMSKSLTAMQAAGCPAGRREPLSSSKGSKGGSSLSKPASSLPGKRQTDAAKPTQKKKNDTSVET